MRWLVGILLLVLLGLQYRLWVGDGSLAEVRSLRDEIAAQNAELKEMRTRNQALEAEVHDLQEGLDALEERARSELGMIKQGEMFLQVIEDQDAASALGSPTDSVPPQAAEGGDTAGHGAVTDKERDP